MYNKYILFLLFNALIFSGTNSSATDILNRIILKYKNNASFRLTVNDSKVKSVMDIDIIQLNTQNITEKIRIHFIEPLDFFDVYLWIWTFDDGQVKKWITKPGSGKKIDITNNTKPLLATKPILTLFFIFYII